MYPRQVGLRYLNSALLSALKNVGKVGRCLEVEDWLEGTQELADHSFKLRLLSPGALLPRLKKGQEVKSSVGCRGDIEDIWSQSLAELPSAPASLLTTELPPFCSSWDT